MLRRTCERTWASRVFCHAASYSTKSSLPRSRSAGNGLLQVTATATTTSGRSQLPAKCIWGAISSTPLPSSRRYVQRNAFEALGIYPPLAANLKSSMAIDTPTPLQRNFIPPILDGRDVLIRDTTGSGKTFGVLLALLDKPRKRLGPNQLPGITSVVVVPNQELAYQLLAWTRSLFPSATEQELHEMIQVIVTPTPSLTSPLIPNDLLDNPKNRHRRRRVSYGTSSSAASESSSLLASSASPASASSALPLSSSSSPSTSTTPLTVDEQVQLLTKSLPHVLVATPARLWNLVQRGVLDLSGIETLVLDEVDHLIRLPKRFASQREIRNRDQHPRPTELAVLEILRSARAAGRGLENEVEKESGSTGSSAVSKGGAKSRSGDTGSTMVDSSERIQVIASSATMNRPMRYWLEKNGWVKEPEWVDNTKSIILPEGIEHHCVVIGPQLIRNMKLESDHAPWVKQESNTITKSSGDMRRTAAAEIDWAEKDQAWQTADKDVSWKEKQLATPGADPTAEVAVERFGDDDDRMLEGVAMACMLDNVKNACVFFCSPFSLSTLATRLEMDFGLSVQQITKAFGIEDGQHDRDHDPRESVTNASTAIAKAGKTQSKGIYIAHESNARGLDLPGLSHVYIVGLPSSPSSYVHMAGRTGRMGQKGQVVTIIRDDAHLEDRARTLFRMLNVDVKPFVHVE
ncbi:hypothetical protein BGZ98_006534 [Dissophora globulifera]|nr:hypothetical protein BGZ98_006534 [Dissophora globulifera]